MTIAKRPELFVIGKTKPSYVEIQNGRRRYDLRPHMRIDLIPAIRRREDLNYLFKPEESGKTEIDLTSRDKDDCDFQMQKIIRRAYNFELKDKDGGQVFWDQEAFRSRLEFGWYLPFMSVDLRIKAAIENDYESNLFIPKDALNTDYDLEIMEILSQRNPEYFLKQQVVWDGDFDGNNFWGLFKYNRESNSGQIDDQKDPIKELRVNPYGYFSLAYDYSGKLGNERKRNSAFIGAIILNTPFLELRE